MVTEKETTVFYFFCGGFRYQSENVKCLSPHPLQQNLRPVEDNDALLLALNESGLTHP